MIQPVFSLPKGKKQVANQKICEGDYVLIYLGCTQNLHDKNGSWKNLPYT